MPKPPLLPPTLVIKILKGEGFRLRNERGTDYVFKGQTRGTSRTVTVATHRKEIPRGTIRSMCRQAGWSIEEFLTLVEKYR